MFRTISFCLLLYSVLISYSFSNIEIKARTAILQDFLSGEILYEKEPDRSIYPASMTKIMTSIVAFDLIKSGDLSLDDKFIVSEKAWRLSTAGFSSMFIMVGDEVSVEDLLRGIIIASGNDACIALAEGIAGTEEEFAILMTTKAKELGMDNTNFSNSSGINDGFLPYEVGSRQFRFYQLKFVVLNSSPNDFDFTLDQFRVSIEKTKTTFTDTSTFSNTTQFVDMTSANFGLIPTVALQPVNFSNAAVVLTVEVTQDHVAYRVFDIGAGAIAPANGAISVALTATGI